MQSGKDLGFDMDNILALLAAGIVGLNIKIVYDWLKEKKNGNLSCELARELQKKFEHHLECENNILQRLMRIETLLEKNTRK